MSSGNLADIKKLDVHFSKKTKKYMKQYPRTPQVTLECLPDAPRCPWMPPGCSPEDPKPTPNRPQTDPGTKNRIRHQKLHRTAPVSFKIMPYLARSGPKRHILAILSFWQFLESRWHFFKGFWHFLKGFWHFLGDHFGICLGHFA